MGHADKASAGLLGALPSVLDRALTPLGSGKHTRSLRRPFHPRTRPHRPGTTTGNPGHDKQETRSQPLTIYICCSRLAATGARPRLLINQHPPPRACRLSQTPGLVSGSGMGFGSDRPDQEQDLHQVLLLLPRLHAGLACQDVSTYQRAGFHDRPIRSCPRDHNIASQTHKGARRSQHARPPFWACFHLSPAPLGALPGCPASSVVILLIECVVGGPPSCNHSPCGREIAIHGATLWLQQTRRHTGHTRARI